MQLLHPRPCFTTTPTAASTMNYLHTSYWIFLLLCCTNCIGEIILRVDPLALLSATLRTYQKAACDTDQVLIACPRGTSISIEFAQYNKFIAKDGISIEELCATASSDTVQLRSKTKHLLRGSIFGSPAQKVPANRYVSGGYGGLAAAIATELSSSGATLAPLNNSSDETVDNAPENCMWPNALQYSLLQTVVEACQKKKHCKFNGSPQYQGLGASGVGDASGTSSYHSSTVSSSPVHVDPCPKRRKIVEVAYKCRPYEFRSKVACHNDVAQLECNPYSRIAVYSASFGRTEYESIQCPQPQGVKEETCLASYATETVMQICHGRRRCNLAADANTFGSPCHKNSRMYLKVVYTCVPKQVLQDRYESDVEPDEPEDFEGDFNELYDDELSYKESEAIPKLYSNTTASAAHTNGTNGPVNNFGANGSFPFGEGEDGVNPVMTHSSDLSLEDDQERLYLYLLIAGFVGVIVCIVIITIRVIVLKRNGADSEAQSSSSLKGAVDGAGAETTLPNGFNDSISELDEADIDLNASIPVPSVSKNENYLNYGLASNLYGSLATPNLTHTSSNLLRPEVQSVGGGATATTGLIANPLLCGSRHSPDIIGITSNAFVPSNGNNSTVSAVPAGTLDGALTPAIVIGSGAMAICSSSSGGVGSSALGTTMVPITSLAQYTTAPTFRTGYIINADGGALQRPPLLLTPPPASSPVPSSNALYSGLQQRQQPHVPFSNHVLANATLRRPAKSVNALPQQQEPFYDGIAPRTLPTGLPANSQFYYG